MRTVIQRVSSANVVIESAVHGAIDHGFVILLGIETEDTMEDVVWLCSKIINLRIFSDDEGHMNKDIISAKGNILLISQFTLCASYK